MAVRVLGSWDFQNHSPITEQEYWTYLLREFNITDWNMTPKSGIKNNEIDVTLTEWDTFDDFFTSNNNIESTRVFVEHLDAGHSDKRIWLQDFIHPANDCIYIFPSDIFDPAVNYYRPDKDYIITIDTDKDLSLMKRNQQLAIILYDRIIKNGGNTY